MSDMSLLAIRAVAVAATVVARVVTAQAVPDSTQLREFVRSYEAALNARDATAVAATYANDADLVLGNLPALRGRGAIEAWWRARFPSLEPSRRATFEVSSARLVAPDVALLNLMTRTGGTGPDGVTLPVREARATWVMRRRDRRWQIEAARALPMETDRVELTASLAAAESLRPHIRAFVDEYERTYDRHDPEALSAFYREGADIIVREGPVIHGTQEIRAWWRAYFSQPRPFDALLIVEEIKVLSDNVALLNVIGTGATLETTDQLVPLRLARATWVIVRENGKWLIDALRILPSEDDLVIRTPGP